MICFSSFRGRGGHQGGQRQRGGQGGNWGRQGGWGGPRGRGGYGQQYHQGGGGGQRGGRQNQNATANAVNLLVGLSNMLWVYLFCFSCKNPSFSALYSVISWFTCIVLNNILMWINFLQQKSPWGPQWRWWRWTTWLRWSPRWWRRRRWRMGKPGLRAGLLWQWGRQLEPPPRRWKLESGWWQLESRR